MAGKSFTFKCNGHRIQVDLSDTGAIVFYDGKTIYDKEEQKAKIQFHMDEEGEDAFYDIDITLIPNPVVIGHRNKELVFKR